MIRVEIDEIRIAYRRCLSNTPLGADQVELLEQLEYVQRENNCRFIGTLDAGGYWSIDAVEFPDEATLMWFKLKWA